MYRLIIIKRLLEDIIIYPFLMIGRLISHLNPLPEEYDIFFFFPFYAIGGAEKVHLQIAHTIKNKKAIIFFTRKSENNLLLEDFKKTGHPVKDISKYTDNKWLYFNNLIFRGIISGYIKSQKQKPTVFNGQCNFGYKIAPWLPATIYQIELIHSFCSFSFIRIPFLPFYEKTVMISQKSIADHLSLYKRLSIPIKYEKRIKYIPNGIVLPTEIISKSFSKEKLTVLYVGRGTPEKRVHIIASIAEKCHQLYLPIRFEFMGDVKSAIPIALQQFCHFYGNQREQAAIDRIYKNADFIILTSDTEGFPLVVMEAMARGLVVIATAVGDIPVHVKKDNGYIVDEIKDEVLIKEEICEWLKNIITKTTILQKMSANNIDYAERHFSIIDFSQAYRELFENLK